MSCYITLFDLSNQDEETNQPFGRALPIAFPSEKEAQDYLNKHEELWDGSPLFAYGTWKPTEEDLDIWNNFCKKIGVVNPLREVL